MPNSSPSKKARTLLVVSVVTSFITPFMSSAVTVALPDLEREFGLTAIELGWVSSAYLLAAAMFLLPFGRWADISDRRRIFLTGAVIHTAASFLALVAPTGLLLIATRCLQGLGGSMIFSTSMAMLVAAWPPTQRGRVLGYTVSAVYLGLSLGPFTGGFLTHFLGWRSIFVVAGILGMCIIGLVLRWVESEHGEARGERFDFPGALLSGFAMAANMYGMSLLPAMPGVLLVSAGTVALCGFLVWESRTRHPLIDVTLFRGNRVFLFSNLAALINYSATFAVTFLVSLYLQYIRGFTAQWAGVVLIAQPALMTAVSLVSGRLSDRLEPRTLSSLGMAIIAIGLGLCTIITPDTPVALIVGFLALLGAGFGLFSSPNTNAVMSSIERRHYSIGSAVLGTMRLVGQMMSMGIVLLIFATNIGRTRMTPDMYPGFLSGMHTAFIIFATLSVAGVLASLVRGQVRGDG